MGILRIKGVEAEVFCCLKFCILEAKISFCEQSSVKIQIFTFISVVITKSKLDKNLSKL